MLGQFDKPNQVSAAATTVAVEEIFARVDIERRTAITVERTESHELPAAGGGARGPVALPQIVQQGNALFKVLQIRQPLWSIGPRRAAHQRDVVCKMPRGGAVGAWGLAGYRLGPQPSCCLQDPGR